MYIKLHDCIYIYNRRAGNFSEVQNFAFFEGRAVNAKIKTGLNSQALVFTCKDIGGCGFLALNREY